MWSFFVFQFRSFLLFLFLHLFIIRIRLKIVILLIASYYWRMAKSINCYMTKCINVLQSVSLFNVSFVVDVVGLFFRCSFILCRFCIFKNDHLLLFVLQAILVALNIFNFLALYLFGCFKNEESMPSVFYICKCLIYLLSIKPSSS